MVLLMTKLAVLVGAFGWHQTRIISRASVLLVPGMMALNVAEFPPGPYATAAAMRPVGVIAAKASWQASGMTPE